MQSELERIQNGLDKNQKPPDGWLTIDVDASFADEKDARQASQNILDVMKMIAIAEIAGEWGADSEDKLPGWLLQTFHEYSQDELDKMIKTKQWGTEWTKRSWVTSINDRVWQWWSHRVQGNKFTIRLIIDGWPYSIKTFEHLLKAAGAQQIKVKD